MVDWNQMKPYLKLGGVFLGMLTAYWTLFSLLYKYSDRIGRCTTPFINGSDPVPAQPFLCDIVTYLVLAGPLLAALVTVHLYHKNYYNSLLSRSIPL